MAEFLKNFFISCFFVCVHELLTPLWIIYCHLVTCRRFVLPVTWRAVMLGPPVPKKSKVKGQNISLGHMC
jgi:hypothetical protein